MHHIGECLSKTQTRPRHILNWASVRSSSVAYSLREVGNTFKCIEYFIYFSNFCLNLNGLVSLTCSLVHLHRRGTQCSAVQWRSLAAGTTWQRSRSPAQRRPPRPRYLVQRGNRSLFTWASYSPSHDTCWLQLGDNLWTRFSG